MSLSKSFGLGLGWPIAAGMPKLAPPTPAEYPYSVTQKVWGPAVWDLRLPGATGPTTPPTKTIGVDALPSGAAIVGAVVNLGGAGGTFSGWDVTAHQINVTATGWTLENNKFRATTGATYAVNNTAADTIIRRNDFDGSYGAGKAAILTEGARVQIYLNHAWGYRSDWIKGQGANVGTDKPVIEHNFIEVGGWNDPSAHSDPISFSGGEYTAQENLLDLTGYQDPVTGPVGNSIEYFVPPRPINTSPHGYTYGATNAIRNSASTEHIGTPVIQRNIILGHKRTGYYPLSTVASTGGVDGVVVDDNIIEEGVGGGVFATDSVGTITFTNNIRFSDGALYDTAYGGTDAPPSAPVLVSFDTIGDTSVRAIFDRAGDVVSHEFSFSANGGGSWSAWTAFNQTNAILGGLPSDTPLQIRLRGVNTHGNGAASNVVGVTTLPASATIFVRANNQGIAYSSVDTPFAGQTAARRLIMAFRMRSNAPAVASRNIFGTTITSNYLQETGSGTVRFRALNSTAINVSSSRRPTYDKWETHVFTIDCAVPGTEGAGTAADVLKHYVLTETGAFLSSALGDMSITGTADTIGGTRVLNPSTLFPTLDILAADGASVFDTQIEWAGIKHGDNTMVLPAFSDADEMEAVFGEANIAATLATFQLGYVSQSEYGVGAADGSDADTWNASAGLVNTGTNSGKSAVKQVGTYTG